MHTFLFLNMNWTFFLQRQNAYRRVSALYSQGEQNIGIPFLQELRVRLRMQSSRLYQTHTTISSSEHLAPIQALLTGNRIAVTLMWLQDNVFWGYVFTLGIHKPVYANPGNGVKKISKPTGAWRVVEVRSQDKLGRMATVPGTRGKQNQSPASCMVPQRPWKSNSGFLTLKPFAKKELPVSEAARCSSPPQSKRRWGKQKSDLGAVSKPLPLYTGLRT